MGLMKRTLEILGIASRKESGSQSPQGESGFIRKNTSKTVSEIIFDDRVKKLVDSGKLRFERQNDLVSGILADKFWNHLAPLAGFRRHGNDHCQKFIRFLHSEANERTPIMISIANDRMTVIIDGNTRMYGVMVLGLDPASVPVFCPELPYNEGDYSPNTTLAGLIDFFE